MRPLLAVRPDPVGILKIELETVRIEPLNVMELLRLTVLFSKVEAPVNEKPVMFSEPPLKVHPAQEPVAGSAIAQPAGTSMVQPEQLVPPTRVLHASPLLETV